MLFQVNEVKSTKRVFEIVPMQNLMFIYLSFGGMATILGHLNSLFEFNLKMNMQ